MVGVSGLVVVGDMARRAVCGRSGIPAIDVASRAGQRGMHAGKWKLGVEAVIEARVAPSRGGVANGAVVREPGLHMVGIIGRHELFRMATVAIGGRPFVTAPGMARCAIQRGMHAR